MPSPMWKEKSSSARGGGGGIGKIVGTAPEIMTGAGCIIVVFRNGTMGYPMTGGITIEATCGTDAPGSIIPFLTVTWIDIGEAAILAKNGENIAANVSAVPVDAAIVMTGAKDSQR